MTRLKREESANENTLLLQAHVHVEATARQKGAVAKLQVDGANSAFAQRPAKIKDDNEGLEFFNSC